jgi:dihydrofolate reductase
MISIIVATSENNVIGKDNKLLWNLSDDLKNFKNLTSGNTVIMGRNTFESIGRPLPNRLNIVVSRNKELSIRGAIVVNSIEDALRKAPNDKETFIIGGSQIYSQSMKYTDTIYMTEVHEKFDGDSFFMDKKNIKKSGFEEISREKWLADDRNECDYSFIKYKR